MTQESSKNRKYLLAERPRGQPDGKTLHLETGDVPNPEAGKVLLRNEYLSLDPYSTGVLGMPVLTGWSGLTQIGKPKKGETLVVAGASGPVGATVGQIGKIFELNVVGIAV